MFFFPSLLLFIFINVLWASSILWHRIQSAQSTRTQSLPFIGMYHHRQTVTKAHEGQMKFFIRSAHFRRATIKRPFLIDTPNDKLTEVSSFLIVMPSYFFCLLIYSITCYANNCIIKDLYLPHVSFVHANRIRIQSKHTHTHLTLNDCQVDPKIVSFDSGANLYLTSQMKIEVDHLKRSHATI